MKYNNQLPYQPFGKKCSFKILKNRVDGPATCKQQGAPLTPLPIDRDKFPYGSRIQRFIKLWRYLQVIIGHWFIARFFSLSSVIVVTIIGLCATAHPPILVLLHA